MATNPFMIRPAGDLGPGLTGIAGLITAEKIFAGDIKENRLKREERERSRSEKLAKEEAVQRRFAEMKQGAVEAYQSGDPDRIAEFALSNPEVGQALTAAAQHRNARTEKSYTDSLYEVMQDPSPENIERVVSRRKALLSAQGVAPEGSTETDTFAERFMTDPEGALQAVTFEAISRDPQRYVAMKEILTPAPQKLTTSQKDYDLAKKEGFEGSFIDFKQAVSGQGPKTELEMLKLRAQIADIEERVIDRQEKREAKATEKRQGIEASIANIDNVFETVKDAANIVQESPTATGMTGAATSMIPGSPSYNLRRRISTLQSNVAFDTLQNLTKGLGAVSEKEMELLSTKIAALDPNMGDEELIKDLQSVYQYYNRLRKKMESELGAFESRPSETSGDRPLSEYTDEELETIAAGE